MIITKFETWWVERGRCLFDEKRQGGAKMGWDVIAIKLTTDTGIEGVATCMAARSGAVSEAYLQESIGPVVLGRDPHDREAIFQELWTIDRHEAFFPVFLPGPVDVALWDICAKEAGLPLYKYIGACRDSLPVYASGNFHGTVKEYVDEALYYQSKGIPGYKAHPGGPVSFDMEVLLFLGMLVSSVVGAFESVVAVLPIVICFQSMVLDMAGNVGTQSLAVTIRVLVDENLTTSKKLHLLWKEMRVGLVNGALLAVMALGFLGCYIHFFKAYAWGQAFLLSGCVGVSLIVAMVISSLVGTVIPMLFHKIHIDPAVASGPLITTINDLVAVVVYYGLAMIVLIDMFHLG